MENEVKQIIDKYKYDKSIKKYSNKYYFHDNSYFSKIETKEDINRAKDYVLNTIGIYKKVYPLVIDDIKEMEMALGRYEIAVHKVLQCYNILKFDYSADELMQLISNISVYENMIKEIAFRKACQD